jgi:hypothetical protein
MSHLEMKAPTGAEEGQGFINTLAFAIRLLSFAVMEFLPNTSPSLFEPSSVSHHMESSYSLIKQSTSASFRFRK